MSGPSTQNTNQAGVRIWVQVNYGLDPFTSLNPIVTDSVAIIINNKSTSYPADEILKSIGDPNSENANFHHERSTRKEKEREQT